jgi:hydroxyacylglutathione hydrolase
MINIEKFIFNDFQVNTFVLSDESGECLIVDPGCFTAEEQRELKEYIEKNELRPVKIINTHCHIDHILGNAYVTEYFKISIAAHREEQQQLDSAVEYGQFFGFTIDIPPPINEYIEDNSAIKFGTSQLRALHVPGHSRGSIALYCEEQKFIIIGDVLFNGSIGRTDLPGGDFNTLINSIRKKILTLPGEVTVYPGHGPSTTIKHETDTNPFL